MLKNKQLGFVSGTSALCSAFFMLSSSHTIQWYNIPHQAINELAMSLRLGLGVNSIISHSIAYTSFAAIFYLGYTLGIMLYKKHNYHH